MTAYLVVALLANTVTCVVVALVAFDIARRHREQERLERISNIVNRTTKEGDALTTLIETVRVAARPGDGRRERPVARTSRALSVIRRAARESLLDVVRHRLIDVRSMQANLRFFVAGAFVLLGVSALVLAAPALPLPRPTVPVDVGLDRALEVPVVSLVLVIILLPLAIGSLVTGALHGSWRFRLPVLLLFILLLVNLPNGGPFWVLGPVVLVLVWAAVIWLVNQRRALARWKRLSSVRIPIAATFTVVLLALALHVLAAWQAGALKQAITNDALVALFLLVGPLFAAGTDYAELAQVLARSVTWQVTGRHAIRTWRALAFLVAFVGLVYGEWRAFPLGQPASHLVVLGAETVCGLVLGVPLVLLARRLRARSWLAGDRAERGYARKGEPVHEPTVEHGQEGEAEAGREPKTQRGHEREVDMAVPFRGLVLAAGALLLVVVVVVVAGVAAGGSTATSVLLPALAIGTVLATVLAAALAALLLWRGHARGGPWPAAGLFLAVVVAEVVYYAVLIGLLELFARWVPLGQLTAVASSGTPLTALNVVQVAVAATTLCALLYAARGPRAVATLKDLFVLNGGLLLLAGVGEALNAMLKLGEQWLPVQGLVLLIALGWDLAMSGELLTNRTDDHTFQRPARVLFYAGYIVLTAAVAAFLAGLGAVHQPAERLQGIRNGIDVLILVALIYLGAPILITGYLLRQPANGTSHRNPRTLAEQR